MIIKFRFWDGLKMIHAGLGEAGALLKKIKPKYTMQFTGLQDKTGKDIYAKDIVRVNIPHETKSSYLSEVWIDYDGAKVAAHPTHKKMGMGETRQLSDYCGRFSNECEVIGNMYQIPPEIESE